MNPKLKKLFSGVPSGVMTGRVLERAVVIQFNQNLEIFPPGYSPIAAIEDGIRENVIQPTNGKYRIKKPR